MSGRHLGHQAAKQRAQQTRQQLDQTGFFGDTEKTEPERQGAEQHDHDLHGQLGHGEQTFHQRSEHRCIATEQPAPQRGYRGNQKKAQPEAVEHVVLQRNDCAR